jgi:hypothetical protein
MIQYLYSSLTKFPNERRSLPQGKENVVTATGQDHRQTRATPPPSRNDRRRVMGCGASRRGSIVWDPAPDDGNTAWLEDMDAFMLKFMERGWKSPTGAEANAAGLGLLDPPFHIEGDLEHGPMPGRREKEWTNFKQALLKDWAKRSEAHISTLAGEAADAYKAKLDAREMPGLGENAVALAKLMLFYKPLQMRAAQFAAYRKKAEAET